LGGVLNDVDANRGGQRGLGSAYYHYYRGEEYRSESSPPGPSQSAA
jgi:hypothetical protein